MRSIKARGRMTVAVCLAAMICFTTAQAQPRKGPRAARAEKLWLADVRKELMRQTQVDEKLGFRYAHHHRIGFSFPDETTLRVAH